MHWDFSDPETLVVTIVAPIVMMGTNQRTILDRAHTDIAVF